jgi:hypothetical protein
MAAPAITSREAWDVRAQQLCDAANLKYTARYDGEHPAHADIEVYLVPSRDRSGEHEVTFDQHTGRIRCDCIAGSYGRPCCHAGTVLYYLAQRAQACTAAEISATSRYHDMWED